jgi:heme A synthase
MRAAHQQRGDLHFTVINWIHVPVALVSMLLVVVVLAIAIRRRRLDDLALLAATVSLALLGNAFVCGVISGPHDRYGARIVWIATLVALIAAIRHFADDDTPRGNSFSP